MSISGHAIRISRPNGVTLVELLMVLAIMGVLLTLAAPTFADAIRNNRLTSQVNRMVFALTLGRSEAVKRAGPVTLCKSSTAAGCTPAAQWHEGWIAFADADRDQVYDPGDGESLLRIDEALIDGYSLRGSSAIADAVTFDANGTSQVQGTFVVCLGERIDHARLTGISLAGRIRKGTDLDGDRIPEDFDSTEITSCTP